jgi:hypothetical protein
MFRKSTTFHQYISKITKKIKNNKKNTKLIPKFNKKY